MEESNKKLSTNNNASNPHLWAQRVINMIDKTTSSIDWNGMCNAASILANSISNIVQSSNTIAENLTRVLTTLSNRVQQAHLTAYTTEDKQKLIESFRIWGTYGWTFHPDAPWNFFFTAPSSPKNANLLMQVYCKTANINSLLDKISVEQRVRSIDFNIAKSNFQNRNYKSCALMLFSLIDGVYLRTQPSSDANKQWRRVGTRGIDRLRNSLNESEQNQWFFQQLLTINLISCLYIFYEPHQGFQNEPQNVINRNFIMHGMGHRKVLRRDCIQLFLLYYNVLIQTRDIPYHR